MSKVVFGICGCGMIARYHAQAIQDVPNAELLGACSYSFSSAEAFCKETNTRPFASYEEMLACDEINAVSICSPSGDHAQQVLSALRAGKHVVVEKPMCITLEDADEIIRTADETGLKVCSISQLRFSDSIQELKRAIEAGEFGKLHSAALTMRYLRTQEYYDSAAWRGTWEKDGGGVLMNQGIHGIDMLCYLLGPAHEICGFAQTMGHTIEVEDVAVAAVRFESGAMATIDASTCCAPGFPKKIVLSGEKGTAVLEEDAVTLWTLPTPCRLKLGQISGSSGASDPKGITCANHTRQFANFVDAVLTGAKLISDASEGKLPLEIILGVYQSSNEGKRVTFEH